MAQWITDMNIVSQTGRPQEVERLQLLSAEHSHESTAVLVCLLILSYY